MATVNTTSTLSGLFKAVFAENIINLQPENSVMQKLVGFRESEKTGDAYQVPVILSSEQGVTYSAANEGPISLNSAVASTLKKCLIEGSNLYLRGQLDYEAAARASKGEKAFKSATQLLVENMMESASKRIEISMLYGQSGIAKVASLASQVITIQTGEWASGMWAAMENCVIDVYVGSTGVVRQAGLVISAIDLDARTVSVVGTTTGIVSGDTIYFKGSYGKEFAGLNKIITNTGTLFNIDASQYSLWSGSVHSAASGPLSFAKIQAAIAKAVAKGGLNEEVVCLINPASYTNLNNDLAGARQFNTNETKGQNGFNEIVYFGQSGKIRVIASSYVKESEAFIFPPKRLKRVGAQDISFNTPGRDDEIFLQIPDMNAYEFRLYANMALLVEAPSKCVKITNIVNS